MAFFQMNYYSPALKLSVEVNVILPDFAKDLPSGETYKTLYLLHGLSDDQTIWMRRTSIERYADEYGIAVVMPAVGRSWYTDMANDANYFTFVSSELPTFCRGFFRGMSDKREDNFIAGLSMGGYGAMKIALSCPESFGGVASLSGTLDIADVTRNRPIKEWKSIFGYDLESTGELYGTKHDNFHLANTLYKNGGTFPKMFIWCGEQDDLHHHSEKFHKLMDSLSVEHKYVSSVGDHSWKWWDLHIQDALEYLLSK